MDEDLSKEEALRALVRLGRDLFTSNVIGSDFDDVHISGVERGDFPNQPGEAGLRIAFSVSWHALGKTGKEAHEAIDLLLPRDRNSPQEPVSLEDRVESIEKNQNVIIAALQALGATHGTVTSSFFDELAKLPPSHSS